MGREDQEERNGIGKSTGKVRPAVARHKDRLCIYPLSPGHRGGDEGDQKERGVEEDFSR